ncbi:hypothetical protein CC80DRAFT_143185 [Byssothecium circinans]|uniref:Uncharacterized protein n=1 Tax=Byssothecium circinans TaxID=147558 RepID=A0A6A5TLP4_9PLEO|nr:hypothetical protein CC80DRAFT_143185 [Byssothecium circinans]
MRACIEHSVPIWPLDGGAPMGSGFLICEVRRTGAFVECPCTEVWMACRRQEDRLSSARLAVKEKGCLHDINPHRRSFHIGNALLLSSAHWLFTTHRRRLLALTLHWLFGAHCQKSSRARFAQQAPWYNTGAARETRYAAFTSCLHDRLGQACAGERRVPEQALASPVWGRTGFASLGARPSRGELSTH